MNGDESLVLAFFLAETIVLAALVDHRWTALRYLALVLQVWTLCFYLGRLYGLWAA